LNLCTIIWIDGWPSDGFKDVAKAKLDFIPKSKDELYNFNESELPEGGNAGLKLLGIVAARTEVDPKETISD
jgi:hypothetical protein